MTIRFTGFPHILYAHSFSIHSHEFSNRHYTFLEIVLITEGSLDFTIDGSSFTAKKGDVVAIPPGAVVSCRMAGGCLNHCHLSVGARDNMTFSGGTGVAFRFETVTAQKNDQIETIMQSLIKSFSKGNDMETMGLYLLLCSKLHDPSEKADADPIVIYVKKILIYIEKNIADKVYIPDIARKLGITAEYASTIFKKATGQTIIQYANKLKVKMAKSLLEKGGISIEYASRAVGIENPAYFSRMFKTYVGISPSGYKRSVERSFIQF